MKAGRELDALVAEKVMGDVGGTVPYYSASLEAMWLVIDAMYQRGYWCQMRTPFQAGADGDGFWAGFTPHGTSGWNGKPDHWTRADDMPHAICLAALEAVEDTH